MNKENARAHRTTTCVSAGEKTTLLINSLRNLRKWCEHKQSGTFIHHAGEGIMGKGEGEVEEK